MLPLSKICNSYVSSMVMVLIVIKIVPLDKHCLTAPSSITCLKFGGILPNIIFVCSCQGDKDVKRLFFDNLENHKPLLVL